MSYCDSEPWCDEAKAERDELKAKIERMRDALTAFAKATGMPGGPSLTIQRHDPSWGAWKKLCDTFANEQKAPKEG